MAVAYPAIQIRVGKKKPHWNGSPRCPVGEHRVGEVLDPGIADRRPDRLTQPDVGDIDGQAFVHGLIRLDPGGRIRTRPAGLQGGLDLGIGVAGEVQGDLPRRVGGGGAPPDVIEVGIRGDELLPGEGLEAALDGVGDELRLFDGLDGDVEAGLVPHLLEDLGHSDDPRIGGAGQLQGRGTVLRLVIGHQRLGPGEIEGRVGGGGVVLGPRGEQPGGRLGQAAAEDLQHLGLVGGLGQRLPDPEVVGGGGGAVQHDEVHVRLADGVVEGVDQLESGHAGEPGHRLRVGRHDQIHPPGLEGRLPLGGVGNRLEGDGIEIGQSAPPVMRVAGGGELLVGLPVLIDERAGADRMG